MKTRTISVGNHFEVKTKWLFWWFTETYFDCCIDGSMAGDYPYEFETKDLAQEFIDKYLK